LRKKFEEVDPVIGFASDCLPTLTIHGQRLIECFDVNGIVPISDECLGFVQALPQRA
jgi:hypothetical protein